jgi:catalase
MEKQETMTRMTGCPVGNNLNSLTAGPHGPVMMQDVHLLEKLGHFTKEQTPPRNVHALGTGAYGTFTVTNDISKYTCANLFSKVGEKTELFARFSGIFTEKGEADTVRDPRGFALKFYTKVNFFSGFYQK